MEYDIPVLRVIGEAEMQTLYGSRFGKVLAVSHHDNDGIPDSDDRITATEDMVRHILNTPVKPTKHHKVMFHETIHSIIPNMHPRATGLKGAVKVILHAVTVGFDARAGSPWLTWRFGQRKHMPTYKHCIEGWKLQYPQYVD